MTVYHGSVCEIKFPDITMSKRRLDFGPAFYLTSYKRQAEKWALRKASRTRGTPVVSVYSLMENMTAFKVKNFDSTNGEWLDFVCACRHGKSPVRKYDIIRGRVANDDVFKTIDAYLRGSMTREEAIAELRYAKPNDQIAINKATAIASLLKFKKSYVVKGAKV